MSSFGVLPEGFRSKTLDEILTELQDAQREAFGADINTQDDSVLGQLNGIYADQIAQAWEVAEAVYRSLYPDSASGEALDNVAAITGALRLPAAASIATLFLNVNAGVTIPLGRVVSIGANGAQWETAEAVTNGEAVQATVEVQAACTETGPTAGNAGAIDTIQTPVAGWSARAALDMVNTEPFELANNQTLLVKADGGVEQTVTFVTADFVSIAAATAAEIATKINSATTGLTATAQGGQVRLQSDTDGSGSSIQVTGGTANPALGYPFERIVGFNPSRSAKLTSISTEPYALANAQTLLVSVDGGSPQTVTFLTADFVAIAAAEAHEVARKLSSALTGARAYEDNGKVKIESLTTGANSGIECTGGSANAALDFPEDELAIGTTGDAVAGRDEESDADFRLRREQLLSISGASTVEAIRAAIRSLDGVVQAFVFENTTDITDVVTGLPPHSFEVVVSGGDETEIAEEIFRVKPAGIETYRDPGGAGRTVTVTDTQGFTHDINFTRPTEVDMFIEITVDVDATVFGGGDEEAGKEEVRQAIDTFGDSLNIGEDVVINRFLAQAFEVAGAIDVTVIKIDDVDPPINTANFVVADHELARFSTARIDVTVT